MSNCHPTKEQLEDDYFTLNLSHQQIAEKYGFKTRQVIHRLFRKFDIKSKQNRNYPTYFSEIKPLHLLTALEDALTFLSWVCFDICKLEIQDGAFRLGFGSYGSTADIDIIGIENNITFDKRTFGKE